MNIHRNEPEHSPDFAASWRELKIRRGICWLVMLAGMSSMHWMIPDTPRPVFGLTCALSFSAMVLADRFAKAFRCPCCGCKYFGSYKDKNRITDVFGRIDNNSSTHKDKACSHCAFPLWSHEHS